MDKDRLSTLPTTNVTARSNPELKTAEPGMVQNGQDLESSTSSLYGVKERRLRLEEEEEEEEEKAKTAAEDRIGDNGEEEDLMGVEQVADFASSVLAAISCWRYRAKALLFDQITTVRLSVTYFFLFSVHNLAATTMLSITFPSAAR